MIHVGPRNHLLDGVKFELIHLLLRCQQVTWPWFGHYWLLCYCAKCCVCVWRLSGPGNAHACESNSTSGVTGETVPEFESFARGEGWAGQVGSVNWRETDGSSYHSLHRLTLLAVLLLVLLQFNVTIISGEPGSVSSSLLLLHLLRLTVLSRANKLGLKCLSVCMYVRPCTKSFFDFNEIRHIGRGRWVMHDGMQYDPIQGHGRAPLKVGNPIFKSYFFCRLQWELSNDHWFLN